MIGTHAWHENLLRAKIHKIWPSCHPQSFFTGGLYSSANFSPAATAFLACVRHFGTASVQLLAALRLGDTILISSLSMMHGGTASEHFFKQTFAGALPQRMS